MAKKVLFFGDSITDGGRVYNDTKLLPRDTWMGYGYVTMTAAELGFENPGKYQFFNRGISGNRVSHLYSRLNEDVVSIAPDYLSILIGINDFATKIESFEKIYDILVGDIIEALPNVKIMILEPFFSEGFCTNNTDEDKDRLERYREKCPQIAAAAKRIAQKYNLKFVPLQEKFDELCNKYGHSCFSVDGIHPNAAGHNLIKNEWIKAFKEIE